MDCNLRRNIHSQSSDPELSTELTRTNSDSSALTADTSKDILHHSVTLFQDQLIKWTDQQHSSYINSLETSFVDELNRSKHLRSWNLQNNLKEADKSRALQKSHNISGQFLILQDGCWKKISHESNEHKLESTADSHVLAGSPLRFISVKRGCAVGEFAVHHGGLLHDKGHMRGSSVFSSRSSRSSGKQCNPELDGSGAEFTGQNFNNEDQQGRSSSMPMEKRLKTTPADDTSKIDQVVPFGEFCQTDFARSNKSSENRGQPELLSELPESFHVPKSDMHYFLRGS